MSFDLLGSLFERASSSAAEAAAKGSQSAEDAVAGATGAKPSLARDSISAKESAQTASTTIPEPGRGRSALSNRLKNSAANIKSGSKDFLKSKLSFRSSTSKLSGNNLTEAENTRIVDNAFKGYKEMAPQKNGRHTLLSDPEKYDALASWRDELTKPGREFDPAKSSWAGTSKAEYQSQLSNRLMGLLSNDDVATIRADTHLTNLINSEVKIPKDVKLTDTTKKATAANFDDAAAWITKASNTLKSDAADPAREQVKRILEEHAASGSDLTDPKVLNSIHDQLGPFENRAVRTPVMSSVLTSSQAGEKLLSKHMGSLRNAGDNIRPSERGNLLMATTIRSHAYVDGNGRLGRTVKAISDLRQGGFQPLSPAEEVRIGGF